MGAPVRARWLIGVLALGIAAGCASAQKAAIPDQRATVLKNWALSRCLAHAFEGDPAGQDAAVSAAAYLEQGDSPIEAYEDLEKLAKSFAAKPYNGSVPGEYKTMKCIDLYVSPDLNAAIEKALAR